MSDFKQVTFSCGTLAGIESTLVVNSVSPRKNNGYPLKAVYSATLKDAQGGSTQNSIIFEGDFDLTNIEDSTPEEPVISLIAQNDITKQIVIQKRLKLGEVAKGFEIDLVENSLIPIECEVTQVSK